MIKEEVIEIALGDNSMKTSEKKLLLFLIENCYEQMTTHLNLEVVYISGHTELSRPTVYTALEGLKFLGHIEQIRVWKEINVCFVEKLLQSSPPDVVEFGTISFDMPKNTCKEILQNGSLSCKETLQNDSLSCKKTLHNSKYFGNLFFDRIFMNVKKLYTINEECKETLHDKGTICKISLHLHKSLNLLVLNDLAKKRAENMRLFSKIALKNSYIYTINNLKLINYIDLIFFNGTIIDLIISISEGNTEKKKFVVEYRYKAEDVPESLLRIDGFDEAYKDWLKYRKREKKEPVSESTAREELAFLSEMDSPIDVIRFSIRVSAKSLIDTRKDNNSNFNKSSQTEDVYAVTHKRRVL